MFKSVVLERYYWQTV